MNSSNSMSPRLTFCKRYRGVDMPHVAYSVTRAERDGVY